MANNEVLQIVVFSVFAGVGLIEVGATAAPLVRGLEAVAQVMLQVTGYVMRFAPFAVFAAVAARSPTAGRGSSPRFGKFMGSFYLGLPCSGRC